MALIYFIVAAIAISFDYATFQLPFKSAPDEMNLTDIFKRFVITYELDEIVDELTEFKCYMTKLADSCQSSNATELCVPFCGVINEEIGWIEARLEYIKFHNLIGSKSRSEERKTTYKMQTIGETIHIDGEHPSTFAKIASLNQKIGVLHEYRQCNIDFKY